MNRVETRRLELLLQLSRVGSMRAVAETMHVTTSTVSQQIAALSHELGAPLVERVGREVRLTPAGRRLAEHAVSVLGALEVARLDFDPGASPAGTVRVAASASAVRRRLLPAVLTLGERHSAVQLSIHEHEPAEALALLVGGKVDLALTYDYDLAPWTFDRGLVTISLDQMEWGLGVPSPSHHRDRTAPIVFGRYAEHDWIVNSRNNADEIVVRTIASIAGFQPRVVHRADSLELVRDMIGARLGVGLLPLDHPTGRGVKVVRLRRPEVTLRSYAVIRVGASAWAPLAVVLGEIQQRRAQLRDN